MKWKAIYLSALPFKFLPDDERERHMEGLRARVQKLVENGDLPIAASDYEHCLDPLVTYELESTAATEQQDLIGTVFKF